MGIFDDLINRLTHPYWWAQNEYGAALATTVRATREDCLAAALQYCSCATEDELKSRGVKLVNGNGTFVITPETPPTA